ncbi:MAG: molybdenum cofactor biosynthesis protein MoaE [Pseudomonadota bacterium]
MNVSIQQQDFDIAAELSAVRNGNGKIGALVSFAGLVRDFSGDATIQSIYLEHYPGMSERALHKILEQATARWELLDARIVHRVGQLLPSEQIVLVITAAMHRKAAFAGCEFIIDYLKTAAPFWKKEQTSQGVVWVETRDSDVQQMQRWQRGHDQSGEKI